jgi:transketolase
MARKIRRHVVALAADSPGAHVGGSMSSTEILTALYFGGVMNVDPGDPEWSGRDYLIYSKGHASASLYAVLAERGFFPVSELASYKTSGSRLAGHPSREIPGIEWATGSLGHGLSVGVGIALGIKHDHAPNRVFVVLGDGECQEGSIWEAAMSAAHYNLDNLVALVDRNQFQEDGPTEDVMALEPFADKWCSFGWHVEEVDGHSTSALVDVLTRSREGSTKPWCVIANTVKGKGISFAANTHLWHYGKLTPGERQLAMAELSDRTEP